MRTTAWFPVQRYPKPGFAEFNYPDDPLGRFFFVGAKMKLDKLF